MTKRKIMRERKNNAVSIAQPAAPGSLLQKVPDSLIMAAIVVVALVLRVISLHYLKSSPFFAALSLDDEYYDAWARAISRGDFVGHEVFYGLPLYPYLLGLLYFVSGHAIHAARIAQAVLDAASCVLLFSIGKRLFGRATGILASVIFALYGMSFFFDGFLTSAPLSALLSLSIVKCLFAVYDKANPARFIALGALLGVTALANSSVLASIPFIVIWAFAALKGALARSITRYLISMMAAVLLILAIVTARNYAVGKDLVPITSHAGVTFYAGNNPGSMGSFYLPDTLGKGVEGTRVASRAVAEKALGRGLKPSEVSAYWMRQGALFMMKDPLRYARLILHKVYLFFWVREIPEEVPFSVIRRCSPVTRLPLFTYGFVSPLAIIGMALAARRRRGDLAVLYIAVAGALLSSIIYFVNARYRMMVEPILIVFAAWTLIYCLRKAGEGRWVAVVAIAAIASLLYLALNVKFASYREEVAYGKLGVSYVKQGKLDLAEKAFRKAIEINPLNPLSHYNLGTFYLNQKRFDDAIVRFSEAIRLNPGDANAHNNIGTVYLARGQPKEALRHFDVSLAINPHQENIRKAAEGLRE